VAEPGCDWRPGNNDELLHASLITTSLLLLLLLLLLLVPPVRSITVALPEKASGNPAGNPAFSQRSARTESYSCERA
jgi:hypothetical protein